MYVNALAEDSESDDDDEEREEDERIVTEVGRVAGWCASFDKVLADPLGLQCFSVSTMPNISTKLDLGKTAIDVP